MLKKILVKRSLEEMGSSELSAFLFYNLSYVTHCQNSFDSLPEYLFTSNHFNSHHILLFVSRLLRLISSKVYS